VLTVQNYTLGNTLTGCNLVSFTYTSNLTSFTITAPGSFTLSGTLPSTLPAAAAVQVSGTGSNNFLSNTDGTWFVGLTDHGTGGTWSLPGTTVPTLSTAAFCALGLLLAGAGALLVRRRARGSAGA
jgi:hypothetical protein